MSQIWHLNYMLMTSYQEEKIQMSERKLYDWKGLCVLTEHFLTTLSLLFIWFLAFEKQTKTKKQTEELGEPLTFVFDFQPLGMNWKQNKSCCREVCQMCRLSMMLLFIIFFWLIFSWDWKRSLPTFWGTCLQSAYYFPINLFAPHGKKIQAV